MTPLGFRFPTPSGPGAKRASGSGHRLYEGNVRTYERFVSWFGYPGALRTFFEQYEGLEPDLRFLDAGCGTGFTTLGLWWALRDRSLPYRALDGFDLTPAMLSRFREKLQRRGIGDVRLRQADVLSLEDLPDAWTGYDRVLSSGMLEYVPRDELPGALGNLRRRLKPDGRMILFISRAHGLNRWLMDRVWKANLYRRDELRRAYRKAGFDDVRFRRFPGRHGLMNLWGHVVEARREESGADEPAHRSSGTEPPDRGTVPGDARRS